MTYLIEKKRGKLVLIAADIDPIETVVFFPSLCKTIEIPYTIMTSKERFGYLVGKKPQLVLRLLILDKIRLN